MKNFTFKATEEELKALIKHHAFGIMYHINPTPEMSERLHFLTKKLHKDAPDVEEVKQDAAEAPKTQEAPKTSSWS